MVRPTEHWLFLFVCFAAVAADKANNLFMAQGTNSEVDRHEGCQDNNIPNLRRWRRDFLLYVIKVQSKASYSRNKRMGTDAYFLSLSELRVAVKWEQTVNENVTAANMISIPATLRT